jgi:lantibiotic modifying enzyme
MSRGPSSPAAAPAILARNIADRLATLTYAEAEPASPTLGVYNLYGGAAGVAVFLAACSQHWRSDQYRGSVYRLLAEGALLGSDAAAYQSTDASLCRGRAAAVYTLCYLAECLDDLTLQDAACRMLFAPGALCPPGPADLDALAGLAGLVIAVSRLASICPTGEVRNYLSAITERLVRSAHRHGRVPGLGGPLAGFAHGLSGTAYALLSAYGVLRDDDIIEAVLRCLELECAAYDPLLRDWPDFRASPARSSGAWCHGWPGVGLARCAAYGVPRLRPVVARDLDRVLLLAVGAHLRVLDCLCCGNFGRVELLAQLSAALGRPELDALGLGIADLLCKRAMSREGFGEVRAAGQTPVGLFQGAAGYGYALLRALAPTTVPSVLLFEVAR